MNYYYEIVLTKNGTDWNYICHTEEEIKGYIDWAIAHQQQVKYVKLRKR